MSSLEPYIGQVTALAAQAAPSPAGRRVVLVVGLDPDAAARLAAAIAKNWQAAHPGSNLGDALPAVRWPFSVVLSASPPGPHVFWCPGLHAAFESGQTAGTRLVTTQASYLLVAWMRDHPAPGLLVATADRAALERHAPDLLSRPEAVPGVLVVDAGSESGHWTSDAAAPEPPAGLLSQALRTPDAVERLRLAVAALDHGRTPPALLVAASAAMEVNDLDAAARDLDEAVAQAPHWPAAHFERGKLWLRRDDLTEAAASFRAAADLLPGWAAAWANLGAAEGELDHAEAARAAFERALEQDPTNVQAINNVGVVTRELGRLAEAEAAFRRVTALAPTLAFGHYNLGHTLFLQGRYQAALIAYREGQRRDAERNPVQAARTAICRLAAGDPAGAIADLQQLAAPLPREYRRQLLADTSALTWALLTDRPDLEGWQTVHHWLSEALAKLAE